MMSADIPKGAVKLGSTLYMFESKHNPNECLVSAHGGYYKNNSTFEVPKGVTIKFYGEHTKVLSDPGLRFLNRKPTVVEEITSGMKCIDYELSKYQGKHNTAGETYESVQKSIDTTDTYVSDAFMRALAGKAVGDSDLAKTPINIITIRNRWYKSDVSLSYVVKAVLKYKPGVKTFHCSFCRSLVGDENPETSRIATAW